jgi:hypothetical protein
LAAKPQAFFSTPVGLFSTDAKGFFMSVSNWIHHLFSETRAEILSFLSPALALIESNGGKILTDAAVAAVTAAEATGGSGQTKAAAAFASVSAVLVSEGIPVVKNAVNLAIETAVANMNASKAATATPAIADSSKLAVAR